MQTVRLCGRRDLLDDRDQLVDSAFRHMLKEKPASHQALADLQRALVVALQVHAALTTKPEERVHAHA